ncbi:alpha/beta-hydrolase [Ramaria rubella]|nr:alpha/beta-hydrolase [Ramaria rubella]
MPSGWLSTAHSLTATASSLTSLGFGAAKASTKLGFSIARGIASIAPIPLLTTSLNHLESLSLLPILIGESITSTSLTAASASLDAISHLLDAGDEASFSLASFVTLVRSEWAQHGEAGRSVAEVARAVAAWAAIQGFTTQWSEDRWNKHVTELTSDDFRAPESSGKSSPEPSRRKRAISRVSVTDDVIVPGHFSQVISADIGEKDSPTGNLSPATNLRSSQVGSPVSFRTNYETWKTLRRLSKMVLAGYGGAGLLFFGTPLKPDNPGSTAPQRSVLDHGQVSPQSDSEVKGSEEEILVHVVEDAEAEAISHSTNITSPNVLPSGLTSSNTHHSTDLNHNSEFGTAIPCSSYSWWNVLLGKHDREIFEGFAFTRADDLDRNAVRSPLSPLSPTSSTTRNSYFSHIHARRSSHADSRLFDEPKTGRATKPPTAIIGNMRHMPRFWVLTDHARRQVVLVVRGTMSFNELAADLTCEPESFVPATMSSPAHSKPVQHTYSPAAFANTQFPSGSKNADDGLSVGDSVDFNAHSSDTETHCPGSFISTLPEPSLRPRSQNNTSGSLDQQPGQQSQSVPRIGVTEGPDDEDKLSYEVHGGMLRLARAMGSKGKPVHQAVSAALSRNRGYELILCGHSLGAGVASLLALMWSDPRICRTVPSSGLPSNRRVSVYCFAPPCITSPALSRLCKSLITSIVYSFDVVSRLSLGSIRDLNKAAFWLCEGQGEASTASLLRRALKGKLGFGDAFDDTEDEKKWFVAVRKTLEANMTFAHLFPPGRVWWAVRNEALHPSHQTTNGIGPGLRLYEVRQVEDVFQQIEFKGDMLSSHLPHQYDRMLTELEF